MDNMKIKVAHTMLLMILVLLALGGCARTKQARTVNQSGFLDDYSILKPGEEETQPVLRYLDEKADWASYNKIFLDPVEVWRRHDASDPVPNADIQRFANNFYNLLYRELDKDYEMVTMPEPNTLRIQVAITDVHKSNAPLDVVTTYIPAGIVVSAGKDFVTGKPAFVGEASGEIKITDAQTGKLMFAGVDRRLGGKTVKQSVNSWDDANKIIELWSRLVRFRLCTTSGRTDCLEP